MLRIECVFNSCSFHVLCTQQIYILNEFDIRDTEFVKKCISRSNVVINMIGQRTETMNFKYEEVHVDWPTKLAQ